MTIFAILMQSSQPALVAKIQQTYPNDHLMLLDTQWLVSAGGTALDVAVALGIYDPKNSTALPVGTAIVFAMASYHGRAPTPVWEWIKTKLEARPLG
jgi:hypothetical protein